MRYDRSAQETGRDPVTPQVVSIRAAARRLQVHENTIRNWIERRIIGAIKLPTGIRRIPESEVARLEREMFAVPTSLPEDKPVPAPEKWGREDGLNSYPGL